MKREARCSKSIMNFKTMKTEHSASTGPSKHRAQGDSTGHTREAGPAWVHEFNHVITKCLLCIFMASDLPYLPLRLFIIFP